MTDADNDAEAVDEEQDAEHTDEDDEEERPISLDLTRAESITLLHFAWEKELELAREPQLSGLAALMSSIGSELSKELYNPEMVDWIQERQEEREEMMEEMKEKMGGMFGEGMQFDTPEGPGFQ